MKLTLILALLLAVGAPVLAQTNDLGLDVGGWVDAAQQFAKDNINDDVLRALPELDRGQIEDFLKHYEDVLQGDYVLDLAPLKAGAQAALPVLAAQPETRPYAKWLKARLDYFDVAEALLAGTPAPPPGTNAPLPVPNPPFAAEQAVWVKKISPVPWPKGAMEYVPRLKPIFTAEHVPPELVWLAEVESGFDAGARSPAGAVGMFQLMPATAKAQGLSRWPLDERKQPDAAAHAAAAYLRQLHARFGDWRLAVAAYNCGDGTVQRLLQRYNTTSYEGISTHLPAETQMYVPKVEAVIQHREGVALEQLTAN
jgi:membrane-bound lytic murein transglycosylase D